MKGYYTDGDFWGWIPGKGYQRFVSDKEYMEAYEEVSIFFDPQEKQDP